MQDGKPMVEMKLLAGDSVNIILRIPIKGNSSISYIEYSRIYYNNSSTDIQNNAGNIADMKFTGFIMPMIRFNNDSEAIYNISCVQDEDTNVKMSFFMDSAKLEMIKKYCRNEDQQESKKADNYLIKKRNFEYIQISNHGYNGIIIPLCMKQTNIEI